MKKIKCCCCGNETIEVRNDFEICPICGWEDDGIQDDDPDYVGGANYISLNQAKKAFAEGKNLSKIKKDEWTKNYKWSPGEEDEE